MANFRQLTTGEAAAVAGRASPPVGQRAEPSARSTVDGPKTASVDAPLLLASLTSPAPAASPPASASFPALLDNATTFNPDTQGAVGPQHLMVTLASEVRIQDRFGGAMSTLPLNVFWGALGGSNVYDPRILYDPFGRRWVHTAVSLPPGASPGLLVAVSQTSDPTANWFRYRVAAGTTNTAFPDSPNVGLTRDWVTIQANMFDQTNGGFFSSHLWVFDKANLYAGGVARFTFFQDTNAVTAFNAAVPAVHYDPDSATNYLVANWNGNPGDGFGYLRLYSISGPVGAEHFTDYGPTGLYAASESSGNPLWDGPWADFAPGNGNFAPQAGTTNKIFLGDARVQNVVFRDGELWCAQHIFLPADAPTRCSVQWWAFTPGGTILQRGRVDDPGGTNFFAYPSIAVNAAEDVLIGYTRFAADRFPSAGYSYHPAEAGPGSLFAGAILKAGEAKFAATDPYGFNRWGDWSATVVDPANDTDLWTLQQYASAPVGGIDRWGTWWGRVSPDSQLSLGLDAVASSALAGSQLSYAARITNQLVRIATGVRLISTLPAGATFLSATCSQGSCAYTNGTVTCTAGDVAELGSVSCSLTVRVNQAGLATNTFVLSGFGREQDAADNTARAVTRVIPAADLGLQLSGPTGTVSIGQAAVYVFTVTNRGPSLAAPIWLTNAVPAGATFASVTPSQGACTMESGVVTCSLGQLSPNRGALVTLVLTPLRSGSLTNRATLASGIVDPNLADDTAVVVTRVNALPVLQAVSDRTINEDTVLGPITFSVSDAETAPAALVVSGGSSDPALVPSAGIALGTAPGSDGALRTVSITPAPDANGRVTITLRLTDADGGSVSNSFQLTVQPVNDLPTVSRLSDQILNQNQTLGPIHFVVGDVETPANSILISAASSNPALIPNANIQLGGGGADRSVTITPATNQSGVAVITISVTDGQQAVVQSSFQVTVRPPPSITSQPQSQVVTNGAVASFRIVATGTPPLRYQWRRNSVDLAGQTNATLTLTDVRSTDAGGYSVLVSDVGGATLSATAALRILVPARMAITRTGASTSISFVSEPGLTYTVQAATAPSGAWINLATVVGTGARITVPDPGGGGSIRFYRVRVQ